MVLKNVKKYLIYFLLLILISCGSNENPTLPDLTGSDQVAVDPIDLTIPEALFTEIEMIEDGKKSTIIMDRLIELIDAVPEDGVIYISIYLFEYEPLFEALGRSNTRNISMKIMMDMSDRSNNESTAKRLEKLGENVEIVRIYNNASRSAINHNKFVLFQEVTTNEGNLEDVIFQTSQNFTESGNNKIQDAVILSGEDLYDEYLKYWQDMKALANVKMANFRYREYEDSRTGLLAYFYPKRKNNQPYDEDTIIQILDNIDDPSSATVKIGMSAWTDSRMIIIEKLSELLDQGVNLEVVTKSSIGTETIQRLSELSEMGATIRIYNMSDSGKPKINMHSKFMLIEESLDGTQNQLLLTGTQNFTMNALRNNNEVTLLFKNHEFFDQYNSYFEELKHLPAVCCNQ